MKHEAYLGYIYIYIVLHTYIRLFKAFKNKDKYFQRIFFAKKNDKFDELRLNSKLASIFASEYGFYKVHSHCFADLAGFLFQYFYFFQKNSTVLKDLRLKI